MDEKIDLAISIMAGRIVQSVQPDHALKFTQAALNLAHVRQIYLVVESENEKRKKASA